MLRATTACTFSTSQLPKVVGKDGSKDAATSVGTLQGEWVGISATREPKMLNRAGDQRIRAITSAARDADDLIKLKSYNAASITTSSERSTSVQASQVMMMVKNFSTNGTNGPSMKLDMDQKLDGKIYTMTSIPGKY